MPALLGLDLAVILFWVGGLIFCYLCVYIAKALLGSAGGAVGWIPGVGGWLKSSIHSVEHKIVSVMSQAAASCDAHMGAALHDTARLIDWMGREINRHANLLYLLAGLATGQVPIRELWREIHKLTARAHATEATVAAAGAAVIPRVKVLERGIGEDVLPRIKSLEREVGGVIAADLPGLRAGTSAVQRGIDSLGTWVHRHTLLAGSAALTGAVGWALARLGGTWIRCNPFQKNANALCGSHPGWWEDLLAGAVLIAGTVSVVEFIREAQAIEKDALDALGLFIREMPRA